MLSHTSAPESMAFLAKNTSTTFRSFNRPYCPHCKIQGHLLEDCFKAGNATSPTCSHCYMSGHLAEKCYKLIGYPSGHKLHNKGRRPNMHTRQSNVTIAEDLPQTQVDKMNLISNQYKKILQLLHEKQSPAATPSPMANFTSLPSMSEPLPNLIPDTLPSPSTSTNLSSTPTISPDSQSLDIDSSSPPISHTSPSHLPVRKSDRPKQAPKYLQDFHCQLASFTSSNPIQDTTTEAPSAPPHQAKQALPWLELFSSASRRPRLILSLYRSSPSPPPDQFSYFLPPSVSISAGLPLQPADPPDISFLQLHLTETGRRSSHLRLNAAETTPSTCSGAVFLLVKTVQPHAHRAPAPPRTPPVTRQQQQQRHD
uniref:CCHC-type domain-containing protein n=1 Tax=Populus alba TaxID=43335 RepID=A0A4U5QF46_POPAL|nr:hypothetical protein D5086_0000097060 [Populus alba]